MVYTKNEQEEILKNLAHVVAYKCRRLFPIIKTLPFLYCSFETRSDFQMIFSAFQLPESRSETFILGFSYEGGGYHCPDHFIRKPCCSFMVGIILNFLTAVIFTLGIHYNGGFTSSKILKRTYQNSYMTDHEKNNNNYKKISAIYFFCFISLSLVVEYESLITRFPIS